MNKTRLVFVGLLIFVTACSNATKDLDQFMVDISEFTIVDGVLKDGDSVEILGASGNITEDVKMSFYNLVVVRSLRTGDTVNVLTTSFSQQDLDDGITRFFSNASFVGKLLEDSQLRDEEGESSFDVQHLKAKTFKKVLYDTDYIQVNVKHYPSITGTLGDYQIIGDLDKFPVPESYSSEN